MGSFNVSDIVSVFCLFNGGDVSCFVGFLPLAFSLLSLAAAAAAKKKNWQIQDTAAKDLFCLFYIDIKTKDVKHQGIQKHYETKNYKQYWKYRGAKINMP